ncbi:MAG: WYL domain-containing protein, partial [Ruminococcus sp.]|nr:WYL domain-containing protein [Ruminococcus sp.]
MSLQSKKSNMFLTFEVLRKYTDENHKLTQKEIADLLERDYEIRCDRKTVKRNITGLIELEYPIMYKEIVRGDTAIMTEIYYEHPFSDSEIKMLCDGLLFSKYIYPKFMGQLIDKLQKYASPFMKNNLKDSLNYSNMGYTENAEVFLTVETLNEAIKEKKQVSLDYYAYTPDGKLKKKREEPYIINPYYTVTANGRYYLICNVDSHDNLSNFRVDKIKNVEKLNKGVKDIRDTRGNKGFNLSTYMKEHIYMFQGDVVHAELELDDWIIGQVIDWFGRDYKLL